MIDSDLSGGFNKNDFLKANRKKFARLNDLAHEINYENFLNPNEAKRTKEEKYFQSDRVRKLTVKRHSSIKIWRQNQLKIK